MEGIIVIVALILFGVSIFLGFINYILGKDLISAMMSIFGIYINFLAAMAMFLVLNEVITRFIRNSLSYKRYIDLPDLTPKEVIMRRRMIKKNLGFDLEKEEPPELSAGSSKPTQLPGDVSVEDIANALKLFSGQ